MRHRLVLCFAVTFNFGCQPRFTSSTSDAIDASTDTGDSASPEEDWSGWEGAELVVRTPESGQLLWLGEDSDFQAEIIALDGTSIEWNEIAWSSNLSAEWNGEGRDFVDDSLTVGLHDLRVETTLPTGDHLVWTVGGVRVQHQQAGTYVGNMLVDATSEYDGTEYTTTCIGAAIVIINAEGDIASGDSNCLISLLGYDIDANYLFDFAIDDEDLTGNAKLDLVWSTVDFETTGEVSDGNLSASWSDYLYDTIEFSGTLDLERISYDAP